eukprot:TRINITY_DN1709_c0_g2_i7.p1 TRINITY_DN1709_c0_g2~~TRINITY_DN1709_c0_g2_i7.p1  ORF type:complete len:860 (-),score=137.23 TRINITY_DN1709_c0_g2_i7:303-2882(-)
MISAEEKTQVREMVPELLFTVDPKLRRLMTATLHEISVQDFPDNWPNLLPGLVQKLQTTDYERINGILKVCNAIFKRFRDQVLSDVVAKQILMIMSTFAPSMLSVFQLTMQQVQSQSANPKALVVLFTSVKLLSGIFYSLNYVDLPAFMEDNMTQFFTGFKYYLTYESNFPELVDSSTEAPGLLHKVKASIFNNINLYAEKYEEEFGRFLPSFVQDTWDLLIRTPGDVKYDSLVTSALQFLTSVANGVCHGLFKDVLQHICEKIIVPNISLRKGDLEQFEDDPLAYVRKDVEGSDSGTRRRSATALIKGLRKTFETEVTQVLQKYVGLLLEQYNQNPKKNWANKDAAIYLVIALASKKYTMDKGVTELNSAIQVDSFYKAQVLPELKGARTDAKRWILLSSCLTFINNFRRQFTDEDFAVLFPIFLEFLKIDSFVIRSYASMCIERFLSIKMDDKGTMKWSKSHLQPYLGGLLTLLFHAMEPDTNVENHYVMKAIARVLAVSQDTVPQEGFVLATKITSQKLFKIYRNPVNAEFGHFLFEALAAIIATMCTKNKSNLDIMEGVILPLFQRILTEPDADTYSPYVFQIMSLLIESRGSLPEGYKPLLAELVKARFWEENGNHPALVRLIQAYISCSSAGFVQGPILISILGIFQRLISSKKNDFLGFYLLETIVRSLELPVFEPYLIEIFKIIFTRVQNSKTVQLVKSFILFLSSFIGKHGPTYVATSINKLQDGMFSMVLKSLWIPNLPGICGAVERKAALVGSLKLLCEFPPLLSDQNLPLWTDLLHGIIKLLVGAEEEAPTLDYQEAHEDLVYNSGFSTLRYASKSVVDYFSNVTDPKYYFVSCLLQFNSDVKVVST